MLQNIGDKLKNQRWLTYVILGPLIIVFSVWGVYSAVDMNSGTAGAAAKVNGEEISATEINELWQQQQPQLLQAFGGSITDTQRTEFQQRLLDNAVRSLATTQHAREMGFRVSDAQVTRAFQAEQAFHVDGQFNLQAARARLVSAGITEASYVRDLRRSLLSNQLLGVIGATDFLTPAETRRVLTLLDEERELRYALLQPESFAGGEPVDPAAIEAYHKDNAEQYTLPEFVRLSYAELSLADVAATVQVSEEQLRERYEQNKTSYVQAEARRASHILISVDGDADDAKAAAQAKDLRARIAGGGDFAALAREFSKDSASAAKGGDLDWAGRDVFVKEFADTLFAMKQGDLSEPVKTQFGYHIIRLDGIRGGSGRSFDDVRAELGVAMRNELAVAQFGSRQDQLQERLERVGTNLAQLAQEFGMRVSEVPRFERGAGGLPLGSDAELNRAVFADAAVGQRRVGGPVQLGEDRITIFQVTDHKPAALRPLAEVREDIAANLRRERGATAALAAAEAAVARLAAGESFDRVSATFKVKAEPAKFISRGSPDLPVELRDAVFAAARPTAGKSSQQALKIEGGAVALLQVSASRVQAMTDNLQLQQLRSQRELQRYTQRDIESYMGEVLKSAKVRTNTQVFQ